MIPQSFFAIALAAAFAVAGCGERLTSDGAPRVTSLAATEPVVTPAEPRFIVVGVDRTESWERMTRPALALAEQTLRVSRPRDELLFRWISDRSYRSDEAFAHIKLPAISTGTGNPFDRREKQALDLANNRFRAEAKKGIDTIRAQHPEGPTTSTDIPGFLAAAAEQFSATPAGYRKVLVIISDMEDNRNYKVRPDLSSVEVQIYLMVISEHPDPAQGERLKTQWTAFLKKCGAASVTFMSASSVR